MRLAFHPRAAKRIANNLRRSLPAISHGRDFDLCIAQNAAKSERDVLCNFASAERAFEFVGCDKDFIEEVKNVTKLIAQNGRRLQPSTLTL